MADKPNCSCWEDPQKAMEREQQIDGIGRGFGVSLQQIVHDTAMCPEAYAYVAASAVAHLVFWVAFARRADGELPTTEQLTMAELEVITMSRHRLEGARLKDLDMRTPPSASTH